MKTTIDIAKGLLLRGQQVARRENTTFRSLVEEGLSLALDRHERTEKFHWKPVTFKGNGISPGFSDSDWAGIRSAIYDGRGA